jgi:hypothetical protein
MRTFHFALYGLVLGAPAPWFYVWWTGGFDYGLFGDLFHFFVAVFLTLPAALIGAVTGAAVGMVISATRGSEPKASPHEGPRREANPWIDE